LNPDETDEKDIMPLTRLQAKKIQEAKKAQEEKEAQQAEAHSQHDIVGQGCIIV